VKSASPSAPAPPGSAPPRRQALASQRQRKALVTAELDKAIDALLESQRVARRMGSIAERAQLERVRRVHEWLGSFFGRPAEEEDQERTHVGLSLIGLFEAADKQLS
jgi:hypothetical protein